MTVRCWHCGEQEEHAGGCSNSKGGWVWEVSDFDTGRPPGIPPKMWEAFQKYEIGMKDWTEKVARSYWAKED